MTRRMLEELGASRDEIAAVYYVAPDGPPDAEDVDAMREAGVTLAVIDALAGAYDASGLDDMARKDAERFARTWIRPLWEIGITTVSIDHVVKAAEARGRYAIGSERKLGTVDVHLGLEAVVPLTRGGRGVVKVTTHKDRPGHLQRPHPCEIELDSEPETHRITWTFNEPSANASAGDRWRPTVLEDRVLECVHRPDYEPLSRSALADLVKGNRTYLLQAIDNLIADERLAVEDRKVVQRSFLSVERGTRNVPLTGNVPRNVPERGTTYG
jgi:hypothetical protein